MVVLEAATLGSSLLGGPYAQGAPALKILPKRYLGLHQWLGPVCTKELKEQVVSVRLLCGDWVCPVGIKTISFAKWLMAKSNPSIQIDLIRRKAFLLPVDAKCVHWWPVWVDQTDSDRNDIVTLLPIIILGCYYLSSGVGIEKISSSWEMALVWRVCDGSLPAIQRSQFRSMCQLHCKGSSIRCGRVLETTSVSNYHKT